MSDTPRRDDTETTTRACPLCERVFHPIRRQLFCSDRCRKAAWRRRTATPPPTVTVPPARTRPESTVYACTECDERYLGDQWCPDCNRPCVKIGFGGTCPACDHPVAVSELLNTPTQEVHTMPH